MVTLDIVVVNEDPLAAVLIVKFCVDELSAAPLNSTTHQPTIVAPFDAPRVAVTVVPDSETLVDERK